MKSFPKSAIVRLCRLAAGESVPASALGSRWAAEMIEDGVLLQSVKGMQASYRIKDKDMFDSYVLEKYGIEDVEKYRETMNDGNATRSDMVSVAKNTKIGGTRGMRGFLVNSIHSIDTTINGVPLHFPAISGLCHYIVDFEGFKIPSDVVIVGIENGENFFELQRQLPLFSRNLPTDRPWMFINRYAKSQDLRQWLMPIPNDYVHFGDLDLAGVKIYITEFYRHLGSRASMLIPEDYEQRISTSCRSDLYNKQLLGCRNLKIEDLRVLPLWQCIHKYGSGYEQEGYISDCENGPK